MHHHPTMTVAQLTSKIRNTPDQVNFDEVIHTITTFYHYTPSRFTNGEGSEMVINAAGTNEGSCKIFAFALLNQLTQQETLTCFGDYYREDVLRHPDKDNHTNIRSFIRYGWAGISFDAQALTTRKNST